MIHSRCAAWFVSPVREEVCVAMAKVADFIRPHLRSVRPYVPGKPIKEVQRELGLDREIIKLASNENTLGPSPLAIGAIIEELPNLWRYPEDSVYYLKEALAEYHDVPMDWIVVGNGMIEVLCLIAHACLGPGDEAIMGRPSFMMYEIMCQMHDATRICVTHPDHKNDLHGFAERLTDSTKVIWIDNPNNPTGTYNSREEVEWLIDRVDSRALIVLDEAYYQFIDAPDFPDGIEYVKNGKAVVALRTFSKVVGLAGIRCGYGVMHPDLAAMLDTLRVNFSVNSLAQAAGLAALNDTEHMAKSRRMVVEGRKYFYTNLDKLGIRYNKTQGNYVWINFEHDAGEIADFLLHEGIIIRPGWVFGAPTCVRVSIGREKENARFFKALSAALSANVLA